jgi:hypothetical protein
MLCYSAVCRILFTISLNVVMLNAVMLSVVMLSVVAAVKRFARNSFAKF